MVCVTRDRSIFDTRDNLVPRTETRTRHFCIISYHWFCVAPDIAAIESRNWLLHRHYTRHEYSACKLLIEQELTRSNGHEYANYLKVRAGLLVQLYAQKVTTQHRISYRYISTGYSFCVYFSSGCP